MPDRGIKHLRTKLGPGTILTVMATIGIGGLIARATDCSGLLPSAAIGDEKAAPVAALDVATPPPTPTPTTPSTLQKNTGLARAVLEKLLRSDADQSLLAGKLAQLQSHDEGAILDPIGELPLTFLLPDGSKPAYHLHPQGLARDPKTGNLYVSAVEIIEKRSADGAANGKGRGYLFCFDARGEPLSTIQLASEKDDDFHPGGMVLRGDSLYLPVSPYRPNSHARILEIPLATLEPRELFTVPDHIGNLGIDDQGNFILASWDSRSWYRYTRDGEQLQRMTNPVPDGLAHQDAELLPGGELLLSGVGRDNFGLDVIDTKTCEPLASLRWKTAAHANDQGRAPFENPTFTWQDASGRVFVLAAPDSQVGRFTEREHGARTTRPETRPWKGSIQLYEIRARGPRKTSSTDPHHLNVRLPRATPSGTRTDTVIPRLNHHGIELPADIAAYLTEKYETLRGKSIGDLDAAGTSKNVAREVIGLHRRMLRSESYVQSRIANPTTGTLDHLHAEMTADLAVSMARDSGYGDAVVELVRIAAHLHDAGRSFPLLMAKDEQEARGNSEAYRRFKALHMKNSVARVNDMFASLRQSGTEVSPEFARDVSYIIGRHEVGGRERPTVATACSIDPGVGLDDLVDLVRDADSLAFFEANILTYWQETGRDADKLAHKIHYMRDRMSDAAQPRINGILTSATHPLGTGLDASNTDLVRIRDILAAAIAD